MFSNRKSSKRPDSELIEGFQAYNNAFSGRDNGPAFSPSVFGNIGEIDHGSFDSSTVPHSMDSLSGQRVPSHKQAFQLYESALEYSTNVVARSISPKNLFGNESLEITRGWLPSSQPNWKIDPSSFEHPLPLQQPSDASLFPNTFVSEPSQILHCDSGYETWDEPAHSLSQNGFSRPQSSESAVSFTAPQMLSVGGTKMSQTEDEKFRFHTCLRASTAMIGDSEEAPESYLNKGQIYHLQLVDTTPPRSIIEETRYRTFIRVSFEDKEQRGNAEAYWRLWKDRRGLAESDQSDSDLRAVEYAGQDGLRMQVEQEFLDGFSVTWTVNPATGQSECNIPVRFNFLSTDFTLAKGVKGISVRLCAKTDQLNNLDAPYQPEICFCNIRVFRDHGAERKLSNDMTNVQKRIQKLTEQVGKTALHEPPKKRKRGSIVAKTGKESDQADHGWSMDMVGDAAGGSHSNKLQKKLTNLRTMLFSGCSESVLSLRGEREDDPEVHVTRLQSRSPGPRDTATQRMGPVLNSNFSMNDSLGSVRPGFDNVDTVEDDFPMTLKHTGPRRSPVPVACFYIHRSEKFSSSDQYYRTIYLKERSTRDLVQRICEKFLVDASKVSRILYTNQECLEILVDDDFVGQITEGQDMIVKFERLPLKGAGTGSPPSGSLCIRLEY